MSAKKGGIDLDPSYIAGLLDAVGRVRFDINETRDGSYTVRPMLRLRTHRTQLRAGVIGEFLENRGYQYELIERDYGGEFFRLQQRSDLQDLGTYLEGRSAHLVRELAFVSGPFADEFDVEILDPQDIYRFTLTRDELRYGWRPRGRFHVAPSDIAADHDVETDDVQIPSLPPGDFRSDYTIEWIAGVYDGRCRYRPSISKSKEYRIGYGMYPVARLHRAGVASEFVTHFLRFCDDYDLSSGDSSRRNTLHVTFTGSANIRRVLDILFPRILVLAEASEALVEAVLPRFDEEVHHRKQGFYELLVDMESVAEASGGPFQQQEYDPEYFADEWREDIDLVQDGPGATRTGSHQLEELESLGDVTLSVEEFGDAPPRYRSIVERTTRDSALVSDLKALYGDRCQLCGTRLASADGTGYSEVHHLRPLGAPHDGPDSPENMVVLCPNHHADFDNGVVRVDTDDLTIEHPFDSEINGEQLSVDPEHDIAEAMLRYHDDNICNLV